MIAGGVIAVLLLVGMSNSRQGDGRGPGKQILDASNRYLVQYWDIPGTRGLGRERRGRNLPEAL